MLTSTNMEDTSGNPPDCERGGLGPGGEDSEQGVDDILLAHQDGDKKVGDDSVRDLSGVCLVSCCEPDEYGHVGRKGDAEKPSIDGKEEVANISDRLGVLLPDVFIVQITLPVESFLFGRDILRRVARSSSRNTVCRFRSGRKIDYFGSMSSWLGGCDESAAERRKSSIPRNSRRAKRTRLTLEVVLSRWTSWIST